MTHYPDLSALTRDSKQALATGPIALILVEDDVEVASTVAHHLGLGFVKAIVFCGADATLPDGLAGEADRVDCDVTADDALASIVNAIIPAATDQWLYFCYNAEYLYFPFSDARSVGEMLAFVTEERRQSVTSYVVDLYAGDLTTQPNAVDRDNAYFDKSGYYALARKDPAGEVLDRQLDIFGGLRWRFEEHIAEARRRVDRVSFFRAAPGLKMEPDRSFNISEYNTIACPWHNSLTAAVASFRTAKALRRNPGSRHTIDTFHWAQSERFTWQSEQLLELGLMEPGQWF